MERQEILQVLQRDFRTAKLMLDAATEKFDAVIREAPSGLPHPDGLDRIHQVSRALSNARQEMVEAQVRLNAFVAEGIIPDRLREGAEREEELEKVKVQSSGE
jgi:hypothetical protein